MTDITKCPGNGCERREQCERFTAPSSKWQSWCQFEPTDCEYFINNKDEYEATPKKELRKHRSSATI